MEVLGDALQFHAVFHGQAKDGADLTDVSGELNEAIRSFMRRSKQRAVAGGAMGAKELP